MGFRQPLSSPFAQNPNSLQNPIPGTQAEELPVQDLRPAARLAAQQAPQQNVPTPPPQPAPQAPAEEDPYASLLSGEDPYAALAGGSEVQGPPAPTALTPGIGLVQKPDGTYGIQEGTNVRDLTENEKKAASYIAKGLRVGGPTAGAILGGMVGTSGGPAGSAFFAGLGSMMGSDVIQQPAAFAESVAGETPQVPPSPLEKGIGAAFQASVGPVSESFVQSGMQNVAKKAATEAAVKSGAEAIRQQGLTLQKDLKRVGIDVDSSVLNPKIPQITSKADLIKRGSYGPELQGKWIAQEENQIRQLGERLGTIKQKYPELSDPNLAPHSAITAIEDAYGGQVGIALKAVSKEARQTRFDPTEVLNAYRTKLPQDVLDAQGRPVRDLTSDTKDLGIVYQRLLDKHEVPVSPQGFGARSSVSEVDRLSDLAKPNVRSYAREGQLGFVEDINPNMPSNKAGPGEKGITFDEVVDLLKEAKRKANFGGKGTPEELHWREVYSDLAKARNNIAEKVAERSNDPELLNFLKSSNQQYTENIDQIRDTIKMVKNDKYASASKFITRNNVKQVEFLKRILPEETFNQIAADAINNAAKNMASDKVMNYYTPEVWKSLVGEETYKDMLALNNIAKAMKARGVGEAATGTPYGSRMGEKATALINKHGMFRQVGIYLDRIFNKTGIEKLFTDQTVYKPSIKGGKPKP